jgi:hypothetical protein
MENKARFDLNAAIENWQNELAAQPNLVPDDRRELETHLRDAIAGFQQRGMDDKESFWLACHRVGQPQQLGEEFVKANPAAVGANVRSGGVFTSSNLYKEFLAAPLELKVFAIFSLVVTILSFALPVFGLKKQLEAIIPFTGWLPTSCYLSGLIMSFSIIYMKFPPVLLPPDKKGMVHRALHHLYTKSVPWLLHLGLIAPLAVQIVFGLLVDDKLPDNNFANPYLTVSPWRPVWTVVIPALWIAILIMAPQNRKTPKHA